MGSPVTLLFTNHMLAGSVIEYWDLSKLGAGLVFTGVAVGFVASAGFNIVVDFLENGLLITT